jgi:hypothetical protein
MLVKNSPVLLLPDAGPLITLAYANALDLLKKPGWAVQVVDMVLHEVTRNSTPTSLAIGTWVAQNHVAILPSKTFAHYQQLQKQGAKVRKANLGELAVAEIMGDFALQMPEPTGVFLFEDHKIARSSFVLPDNCRKVSTRAFLIFLERNGWIASAAEVERVAIQNGRQFSQIKFPPD